jgi:hypothetical protein
MTHNFREFIDKKSRESKQHLKVIKKALEETGFTVEEFFKDEADPYIFLNSNNEQLSFEGVRIYTIGDIVAFRVQKEKDTHPYGKAYSLDIVDMFNDLMSENGDEEKSGKRVIKAIAEEFKNFFKKSAEAEKDLKSVEIEKESGMGSEDGSGKVMVQNSILDFASMARNKM